MKLVRCLIALLLFTQLGFAQKVATFPKPTGYVDDYAGVLSPDAEADIDEICHEVHQKANAQIFFVTIKSLGGETIETYSNGLFHAWKIGDQKRDRGVLVLLAINDHKRRVEVGYGLEGILPDAKVGEMGRDIVPALKAEDYDRAGKLIVREIANVIAEDSRVSLTSTTDTPTSAGEAQAPVIVAPTAPPRGLANGGTLALAVVFLCFFGIFGLILFAIIRRARSGFAAGPGFYDSGTGTNLTGFSGGDSGSGSSDSGSPDSFSGGDGGDSGGGGASGDW